MSHERVDSGDGKLRAIGRELSTSRPRVIEAAPSIPTDPVDVVADALDGREDVVVVGSDQVDLSRQARGALSKCRVTGVPAGPTRSYVLNTYSTYSK